MPINASQAQDIESAKPIIQKIMAKINKLLRLEDDPIECVIDFDALTDFQIDNSYRNVLATRIYDNYISTVDRFLSYQLEYTNEAKEVAHIYIEEYHNRWWARELSFEFAERDPSWKTEYGHVLFRDGALVIQVPAAKFNWNAYDVVYQGMDRVLDVDIGEGPVAKYKASAYEANKLLVPLQEKLRKATQGESYTFDMDFERYWIGGHIQLMPKDYQLRAPVLAVKYAERLTYMFERFCSECSVTIPHLNEMLHARKLRILFGPVVDTANRYDMYVEGGALVLKVPEKEFCCNVSDIGGGRGSNVRTLLDRYVESKPKAVSEGPSEAELLRLEKRKQREEEALRKKQERERAMAEARQKYETESSSSQPELPPVVHEEPAPSVASSYTVDSGDIDSQSVANLDSQFTEHVSVSASPQIRSFGGGGSSKVSKAELGKIYGKIKFVNMGQDYKVKVVSAFPDLKVKKVDAFPNSAGKWKIVDSFPDYKIKLVDSFPDFTIKYVDSFPGVR